MSKLDLTVAMPSDWLKWEEDGWMSRENGVLRANSGNILSGMVLAKDTATGKLIPIVPSAGDATKDAVGILLFSQANSTADLRVSYIARQALVADKALRFPAGTTAPQKDAAFTQLEAKDIQVREGV